MQKKSNLRKTSFAVWQQDYFFMADLISDNILNEHNKISGIIVRLRATTTNDHIDQYKPT